MGFLSSRQREKEWLDEPDADPKALAESLAYIRFVNRLMGYTRLILQQLNRFSANWKWGETIRILDVGTGSADIPLAILRWADEKKYDVRVVGIDLNPAIVREAAAAAGDDRITIVRGDAMRLPFGDSVFDYAITSMFLHHLDDVDAERALAEMGRVSSRGIIASDLLRQVHAYAFISMMTLFSHPMVRHDARVSVAQAFTKREILAIRDRAGIEFAGYHLHWGHRFVLAGEKANIER